VELKNGETYNGHLFDLDYSMNLNLRDVIRTSKDGDVFWSVPELFVRGNTIKYVRVPDVIVDVVMETPKAPSSVRHVFRHRLRFSCTNTAGHVQTWCSVSSQSTYMFC
jgi:LSM domain